VVVTALARRVDRNAAAYSASLHPTEHEHAVTEVAKLLTDHAELLPGVADAPEIRFDAFPSPIAAALETLTSAGNRSKSGVYRSS
jgi:hypothetical protein